MYEIKITSSAAKYYKKVDSGTKQALNKCFENLKVNPVKAIVISRSCMVN